MARKPVRKRPDVTAPCLVLRPLALVFALGFVNAALAQNVTVTPSLEARLSWTDNVNTESSGGKSDWLAEVSPGVTITRAAGRIHGNLTARWRNVAHTNESGRNASFLTLQGQGEVEAVDDLLFISLSAASNRNNRSAFSGRSTNDSLNTSSNDETRTWSIAPRLQFHLGEARGSVGYSSRWLDSGSGTVGRQRRGEWTAQLSDPSALSLFGWGVNYSRSESDYGSDTTSSGGRKAGQENGRATLYINASPQFRLRAIGGYESNDYESGNDERGTIWGGGFDWNPTERTTISATSEKRMFGRGYDVSFNHRMARSNWHLSFSKDLSSSLQALSVGGPPTQEELLCAQLANVLSQDPAERQQIYLSCLNALGFDPITSRRTVLTNAQYVDKRAQAGFSLIGTRNTLGFTLSRSDRSRIGAGGSLSSEDDFANTDRLITTALSANLNHHLSARTSLTASVTRSRSQGATGTGLDTRRLLASVGLSTELGPHTYGGLTYRYQRSQGSTAGSDFTENAVIANIGMRF